MEMGFKLTVKDGEMDYKFDAKSGTYKNKTIDDVRTYDSLAEALAEFLYVVGDEYNDNKVSLSFAPKKDKK
jgi:hypothetical protein